MRAFPSSFCPRFLFLMLSFCSALGLAHAQVPKIGTDTTLDIVTWNIEWFGDSLNGPSDEVTQLKNVSEVIASMDMDIISLCEVSNPNYWQKLQNNLPDYGAVITNYSQTQKTALLYRKTMFKLLYSKSILLAFDYEFASGRFPLEVALETQWGSKRDTVYIWVIHLKANTGTTAEKLSSYDRRAKAAEREKQKAERAAKAAAKAEAERLAAEEAKRLAVERQAAAEAAAKEALRLSRKIKPAALGLADLKAALEGRGK